MEVGIRKQAWQRAWRYPAYLWSLRWVYAVKKTRRLVYAVYPRIPPPQYTIINNTNWNPDRWSFVRPAPVCVLIVLEVLTAFFRAFNCRILYGVYLPTVILTVIWYFITHSLFLSRLKTFLLYKSSIIAECSRHHARSASDVAADDRRLSAPSL